MSVLFSVHGMGLTDAQLVLSKATAKESRGRQKNLGELHVVYLSQLILNCGSRIKHCEPKLWEDESDCRKYQVCVLGGKFKRIYIKPSNFIITNLESIQTYG